MKMRCLRIQFSLFCIAVLLFSGCMGNDVLEDETDSKSENETDMEYIKEPEPSKPIAEYEDCRAVVDDSIFFRLGDEEDWDIGFLIMQGTGTNKNLPDGFEPSVNAGEMAEKASNVVAGRVLDVSYTDQVITGSGNTASTLYSFAVSEVLKGDSIREETIITILEYQGYMRRSVKSYPFDSRVEHYQVDEGRLYYIDRYAREPLVKPGDEYVLFLEPGEWEFAEGIIYRNELAYQGKYIKNPYGLYEKYEWENEMSELPESSMTLEELRSAVTSQPVEEAGRPEIENYKDCRATVDGNILFQLNGGEWGQEGLVIVETGMPLHGPLGEWESSVNAGEMAKKASNIVVGKVLDVSYTDCLKAAPDENMAGTVYSFAVSEVLKGDSIKEESVITVLEYQGYLRRSVEKYALLDLVYVSYLYPEVAYAVPDDRVYYVDRYLTEPLVCAGDEYVLFLEPYQWEYADGIVYRNELAYQGKYIKTPYDLYEKYVWGKDTVDLCYYRNWSKINEDELLEPPMTLEELRDAVMSQP